MEKVPWGETAEAAWQGTRPGDRVGRTEVSLRDAEDRPRSLHGNPRTYGQKEEERVNI